MYSGVKAKYQTRKNTKLILVTCIFGVLVTGEVYSRFEMLT